MALEVQGLTVLRDGRAAVREVSLAIVPGQVTAVLGANGAGKSELVLGLAGMLPVAAGRVACDGLDLTGRDPATIRPAGVAAVPEGHRVFGRLSVEDNLRAAGSVRPAGMEARLADTWALFPELAGRRDQITGTLSGGQQQMLALGHAMMAGPKYLLIDEMSLGLAPLVVRRLMEFVAGLTARGVGVLLIEQFTDMALAVATQAVVLRGGAARYVGPAAALRDDPTRLDAAYFGG